jgi:hypothetical protein
MIQGPEAGSGRLEAGSGRLESGQDVPEFAADDAPISGLRNPQAAVRGVGMATLILEAIVLLLALVPISKLSTGISGGQLVVLAGLAVGCLLVCGLLRRPWGWRLATVLQLAVVLTGFIHYTMFVLGGVFLLIWLYVLRVRVTVSRPAKFDH